MTHVITSLMTEPHKSTVSKAVSPAKPIEQQLVLYISFTAICHIQKFMSDFLNATVSYDL